MVKGLPRIRILHRDIDSAESALQEFLRCYGKLRERAEKIEHPEIAQALNRAAVGLSEVIGYSADARNMLDGIYRVTIAMNRQRRLK